MDALSLLPQHHQTEFDSRYRIVLIAAVTEILGLVPYVWFGPAQL